MTWDPRQYLRFEDARLRPAADLLARVPQSAPRTIADLGCGTGNVTRLLTQRWPQAQIVGVDSSAPMLEQARAAAGGLPQLRFVAADLAKWSPATTVDLVYSNAALHWLPDHAGLFARLAAMVADGGTLAVQMPDNFRAPSHTAIATLASSSRWRDRLHSLLRTAPVAPAADYYRWLAPRCSRIDIWTTEYLQVLPAQSDGEHPVAAWTRGTWLAPFLAALAADEAHEFVAAYTLRLCETYPVQADGTTLFPFRRLFIVANR